MNKFIAKVAIATSFLTILFLRSTVAGADLDLPPGNLGSSVDDVIEADKRDFARCLRDLLLKFRLSLENMGVSVVKDEASSSEWTCTELDRSLDLCIRPSVRFKNLAIPVSLHVEFFENVYGCAETLRAFAKSDMKPVPLVKAAALFKPHSVWVDLMTSEDLLHRERGWPLLANLRIDYEDVCHYAGRSMICYGYSVWVTCKRDESSLDEKDVVYDAASGLDPAINRETGTLYPRSGRLIDKFPPMEGIHSGEKIKARHKAALFNFMHETPSAK